jgi:hypothetical protein
MSRKADLLTGYFPNIYLGVTSLMQGLALSQLVPIILTYIDIIEDPWSNIHFIPLVIMLIIIFIVWHHYAISIFYLRWFPNIIDTAVPFIIGMSQFVLIYYLNIKTSIDEIQLEPWTRAYGVFLTLGSFAYISASWRLEPDLFSNIMSEKASFVHASLTKKYYTVSGLSILGQGLFAIVITLVHLDWLLIVSLILLISHLVLFEYFLLHSIKPHYIKAMDEFEEELKLQGK